MRITPQAAVELPVTTPDAAHGHAAEAPGRFDRVLRDVASRPERSSGRAAAHRHHQHASDRLHDGDRSSDRRSDDAAHVVTGPAADQPRPDENDPAGSTCAAGATTGPGCADDAAGAAGVAAVDGAAGRAATGPATAGTAAGDEGDVSVAAGSVEAPGAVAALGEAAGAAGTGATGTAGTSAGTGVTAGSVLATAAGAPGGPGGSAGGSGDLSQAALAATRAGADSSAASGARSSALTAGQDALPAGAAATAQAALTSTARLTGASAGTPDQPALAPGTEVSGNEVSSTEVSGTVGPSAADPSSADTGAAGTSAADQTPAPGTADPGAAVATPAGLTPGSLTTASHGAGHPSTRRSPGESDPTTGTAIAGLDPAAAAGAAAGPSAGLAPTATRGAAAGGVVAETAPAGLATAVEQAVTRLRRTGDTSARLVVRLDPPELGSLTLTLRSVHDTVEVVVRASTADGAAAVGQQQQRIRDVLADRGLDLTGFTVRDASTSASGGGGSHQPGRGGRAQDEQPAQAPRSVVLPGRAPRTGAAATAGTWL